MFRSHSRTVTEPLADDVNRMMLAQFRFATRSQVVEQFHPRRQSG